MLVQGLNDGLERLLVESIAVQTRVLIVFFISLSGFNKIDDEHGYRVFILPNPKGFRTADFIFERKGVYKMFDLKTIIGRNSVGNRLKESVGQSNSVLLNLKCSYGIRNITDEIKRHFEMSPNAVEVLIFFGNKQISVKRNIATSKGFLKMMMNSFRK